MDNLQVGRGKNIHAAYGNDPTALITECGAEGSQRGGAAYIRKVKGEVTCRRCLKIVSGK